MKQIKQIELVFENCEVIKLDFLPNKNWFAASDISEYIWTVNGGCIHKQKNANMVQIIIPNEQYLIKSQIGTTLVDKLEQRDITSVVLILDSDNEEEIHVIWDVDQQNPDCTNDYQHNEYMDDFVVININDKYK